MNLTTMKLVGFVKWMKWVGASNLIFSFISQ
jgi:C4-dicarboxylate transporter